jgi:arylsulfatase A-like enzyme
MGALFLAVGRGAKPGAELGELHSLDVAPTILSLLGLEVPDSMQGRPIASLLAGPAAAATAAKEKQP